jgi:hypothetical protein
MRIYLLIAVFLAALGSTGNASAGLLVSVAVSPPPLPVYVQPPIPGPGYIWAPGYWAWDEDVADYYWTPGAWVPAPMPGLLWTPGYWSWSSGVYVWNEGYWAPHVGYYGGVCYGFGYTGSGFSGGYWSGNAFYYNRSVANIGATAAIKTVYSQTVINTTVSKVSYNGGASGIRAAPTPQDLLATNERRIPPTRNQVDHIKLAAQNKDLHASVNKGKPAIAAVTKAGDFSNPNAAKGAPGFAKPPSVTAVAHNPGPHRRDIEPFSKPKAPAVVKTLSGAPNVHPPKSGSHDALRGPNKNAVAALSGPAPGGRKIDGAGASRLRNGPPPGALTKAAKPAAPKKPAPEKPKN